MRLPVFHIMFGVLWAMLVVQIGLMNISSYGMLTRYVENDTRRVTIDNENFINEYGKWAAWADMAIYIRPSHQRMINVHRRSLLLLRYLDSVRCAIAVAAGGFMADSQSLNFPEDRKWRKKIFADRASVLSLLSHVDSLNEFFIRNTHPWAEQRYSLRRDLPSKWRDVPWEEQAPCREETAGLLYNSNAVASLVLLSGICQNIVLAEKLILGSLHERFCFFPFDAITSLAVPDKLFAVPGESVSARIFIASYDKNLPVQISSKEGHIVKVENSIGIWKDLPGQMGAHQVSGSISFKKDSVVENRPWSFQYMVGPPYAALQLDKMTCIYRGIPNPVSIHCAAGYDSSPLSLIVPGATVIPVSSGSYLIRVKDKAAKQLTAMIVYARDAKLRDTIGGMIFRVKDLPLPVATIGTEIRRSISIEGFTTGTLSLVSPDDDLEFTYTPLSYTFSFLKKGDEDPVGPIPITGASYSANTQVQELLRNAAKGDRVFFSDIKALSPDGSIISPEPLYLRLE